MSDLFSPLAIGDLALPNRIVMAPLTRSRATPERVPTPMMVEHYVQRASAGLIIAEATNVVAAVERLGLRARASSRRRKSKPGGRWSRRCTPRAAGSRCSSGTAAASPPTARRIPCPRSRLPA